jgi:hypothetical protein
MSTISSVGNASSALSDLASSRASAMKQKMFAKVDSDGSGTVDKSELQTMLDKLSERSGQTLGSADDLLGKMDSNGDGSLDSEELDAGMKSLMPPPSSTMDFASKRAGGGGPPPPPPGEDASSSSSSSSTTIDPLDTNQDGTVSAQERAAGELKDLLQQMVTAMDTDGNQEISQSEADDFSTQMQSALQSTLQSHASSSSGTSDSSTSSSDTSSSELRKHSKGSDLEGLVQLLKEAYGQYAANAAQQASGSALSVAA